MFILAVAGMILFQSVGSLLVMIQFKLNQDFIARNLCVNRAKPSMHCNGKCHLKKMLDQSAQKEKQTNEFTKEKKDFWVKEKQLFQIAEKERPTQAFVAVEAPPVSQGHATAIFHPPCQQPS